MNVSEQNHYNIKPLLTPDEVAKILRTTRRWVMDHSTGGHKPVIGHVKLSPKKVVFTEEAIAKFVNGGA